MTSTYIFRPIPKPLATATPEATQTQPPVIRPLESDYIVPGKLRPADSVPDASKSQGSAIDGVFC